LIVSDKLLAKKASIKYQTIPINANVNPKKIKGIGLSNCLELINCGKKTKKNNATLGFKILVKKPDQKMFFLLLSDRFSSFNNSILLPFLNFEIPK